MVSEARLDEDLQALSRDQLIEEVKRLRAGIRRHPGLLPEKTDPLPDVPTWPEFVAGCVKYRSALDKELPVRTRSVGEYEGEGT